MTGTKTTKTTTPRKRATTATKAGVKTGTKVAAKAAPKAAVKASAASSAKPETTTAAVAAKPAVLAVVADRAVAPDPVSSVTVAGPTLKKKDLFDRVTAASGAKKRDVKLIVEATLKVLGDALSQGEELNLPPFGKAKVNRQRDLQQGEMMMVKVRRGGGKQGAEKDADEGIAEDDD